MAAAIIFVAGTVFGSVRDWWTSTSRNQNFVTFETPREPTAKGIQDVLITFKPAPLLDEKVQVWIQEGDLRWYKCVNVKPLSVATSSWEATCQFGKPDSPNPKDWAKHGTLFPVAAFVWKTELRDNAGIWPETWDALKIVMAKHDVEYRGY